MNMARWWNNRPGVERLDLTTRAPLYLTSVTEPMVMLLVLTGEQRVRPAGAVVLLVVTVAHTIACVLVLRAGLRHRLGGPEPDTRLMAAALALTAAGLAAGPAAFAQYGRLMGADGFPIALAVTLVFCGAVTAAVTPILTGRQLVAAVVLPAALLTILQLALGALRGQASWTLNYLFTVGTLVVVFRSSVWVLGLVWEIDRARDTQARLAVAEERLRVARDLHDVLGRNLTLIAVNSELAAGLAQRRSDEAAAKMMSVRQLAQDSMREVREVVGGHRSTDLDVELAGARAVLRSAGIDARVIGESTGLPTRVQTAFGWAVREATTNILRHADPTRVTIDLDCLPDSSGGQHVRLRIENDGVRHVDSGSGLDGHGTGLAGLRERLAQVGGQLATDALPDGRFRVDARLPLAPGGPAS